MSILFHELHTNVLTLQFHFTILLGLWNWTA